MNYTLKEIRDKGMIIFEAVMGSKAYGTSLPTSDTDIRGIFIQPLYDILKYGYVQQVADTKNDIVFYELKRFMELAASNNPNILELLNAPDDCVLLNTNSYMKIREHGKDFLSKIAKNSFGGYAIQQIKKSRGLNKKMNWDENEMIRKGVLDFCYIVSGDKTIELGAWLNEKYPYMIPSISQKKFGLSKIDHARDSYAMFDISEQKTKKGIIASDNSNEVQLSSIPKGLPLAAILIFNKDAYSSHCKLYNQYQVWLKNRNEDRVKMNKSHGKKYDSKNMSHCIRLLDMAIEIGNNKGIIVRRPDEHIKILMNIRKGKMDYEPLLLMAEQKMKLMDQTFENSSLKDKPDLKFIKNMQFNIRLHFYKKTYQI